MIEFDQELRRMVPELVALRHELHRHPELAFHEQWTSRRVLDELEKISGLSIRTGVAGTGIVATLNADKPGRCVALRSDIDALPIREANTFAHRSEHDGRMHACGHDGHMTCLIGAARLLAAHADELPGRVKFIFQPAEENDGGGRRTIEDGALRDPDADAAFAMHGWPAAGLGQVLIGSGAIFAAGTAFDLEVTGQVTHAAYPHQGTDVVLAASHIVTALQAVVARMNDPVDPCVVSVTSMHAGETYNVIPGQCHIKGTVRALRQETHDRIKEQVQRVVCQTAAAFDTTAMLSWAEAYPSLVNDSKAAGVVQSAAADVSGMNHIDPDPAPSLGREDFAIYAQTVPAAMWWLGLRPPDRESYPQLHKPDFDFPDAAIPLGVGLHCRVAERFLSRGFDA